MTELLCVERGIPIFGRTLDGNSSDKPSNNKMLTRISKLMARHGLGSGAFVYVADSAMVSERNLESIGENYFITRLPANYSECNRVIDAAVTSGDWRDLGILAETPTKSNRPKAIYRALESGVELYGKSYRATVVHSSSHDRRRQKKLEKAIVTSQKELAKRLSKLEAVYYCEADAESASKKSKALSTKLHKVVPRIDPFEVRKPGRPPINAPASTTKKYRLTWDIIQDTKAIEREKQKAGCFVLLSNIPIDSENSMDSRELLLTYKGQYGVESNFGFLKDPLVVNDIFLKKPHRIDTLGMVLIIALLVWRLMERTARCYLKDNDKYIEGWNKRPTQKPTSFMISTAIVGIMVAVLANRRIFLRAPGQRQKDFLLALAVDENVFLDPQARCHPKIPSKKGDFG
jgi:transposase